MNRSTAGKTRDVHQSAHLLDGTSVPRIPLHQYFVPNYKAKTKSRANALVKEFLSRVFASDGASRFFKTFLLRFLFDGGSKSSDDCYATLGFAPAR